MKRFNQLGKLVVVLEILFVLGASFEFYKIRDGYDLLQIFSAAQNVVLKYNEQGQLLNLGKPEATQKIVRLLTEDWGCPVVELELDPNNLLALASHRKFNHASATTALLRSRVVNHLPEAVDDGNTLTNSDAFCLLEDAVKV